MIKDSWDKTTTPDLNDFKTIQRRVSFDWPLNIITKPLNWQKRFYNTSGINIIGDQEILPFKIYTDMWEGKKCVVFDYGTMKDYVRQLHNKTWVGFLVNHQNKIILWFKLSD